MKKFPKLSLYYQYLFLYFIAVFIPALIIAVALFASYHQLKEEVIQSNLTSVQLIQHSMDSKINELSRTLRSVEQDPALTENALETAPYQAINSLKKTTSSQDFVAGIILHERDMESFYSSSGRFFLSDIEEQSFCQDLTRHGYSYMEWLAMLSAAEPVFWPTNSFRDMPEYLYLFSPVLSSFQYDGQTASRSVVLLIRQDDIRKLFLVSQTDMEENLLLLNASFEILHYLAPEISQEALLEICDYMQSAPEPANVHYLTLNGEKNMLFISRSEDTGLYYVRFLPEKHALQTANSIRAYIAASLILVMIVGILLIALGIRKSYTPIRVLADKVMEKQPSSFEQKNELFLFEQTFDKIFEQNSSLSEAIQDSRYGLVDQLLSALVRGNFSSVETFHNACKNLGISFDKKYFAVCSVLVEQEAGTANTVPDHESIDRIIQDGLPETFQIQIKDLLFDGKMLFVLNSDSNDPVIYRMTMTALQNRLLAEAGLFITIGMGTFYDSYDQIRKSYLESMNALDYRLIYGKGSLITSDIYNSALAESGSDTEIEEQFVKYIHENCCRYDFQISAMAEHFSISSQYMRKLFRNYTGQGISEYVTNVKLERAMQLLRDTDMTLQDITNEIGLTDVSGFIRLFKKRLGITPSQYRKSSSRQVHGS